MVPVPGCNFLQLWQNKSDVFLTSGRRLIMQVQEILRVKGSAVVTTTGEMTIGQAAQLLHEHRIGAAVVVDKGEIVGIISERDIVNALASHGADAVKMNVDALMTRKVIVCEPDDTINFVMASMTERRIRHLPVVKAGKMLGLISIGDVVKHRLGEIEEEASVLRDYVNAR
jgi:CBS domain-containing protein